MEVLTLAIAVLGLLIACLSFGWQIASWLLDGRRAKLVLKNGAMGRGGRRAWVNQARWASS